MIMYEPSLFECMTSCRVRQCIVNSAVKCSFYFDTFMYKYDARGLMLR